MANSQETSSSSAASPPGGLIPHLPDDISIRCIALVPFTHYPYLSLVSRSWRSLLRSATLAAVRSELAVAQPLLALNIRTHTDQSSWYLLDRSYRRRRLIPFPPPPVPTLGPAAAALGHRLFLLGGSLDGVPSSNVYYLDARLRGWFPAPRMSVPREFAAAGSIDGKIYVVGGCLPIFESWAEVLTPVGGSGKWKIVPSPIDIREKWMHGSSVLNKRLLAVADRGGVVYDPSAADGEGAWGLLNSELDRGWRGRATAVGGVLYSYDSMGKLIGYDSVDEKWKKVEGLERELPRFLCGATLADLRGTLCLVWEGEGKGKGKETVIVIAGIEVSRTSDGELRGSLAWSESISMALPKGCAVAHCLALEL